MQHPDLIMLMHESMQRAEAAKRAPIPARTSTDWDPYRPLAPSLATP